jgi:hypothetical protein
VQRLEGWGNRFMLLFGLPPFLPSWRQRQLGAPIRATSRGRRKASTEAIPSSKTTARARALPIPVPSGVARRKPTASRSFGRARESEPRRAREGKEEAALKGLRLDSQRLNHRLMPMLAGVKMQRGESPGRTAGRKKGA